VKSKISSFNIGKSETLSEFPEFDKSNSPLPVIKLNQSPFLQAGRNSK